VNFSGMKVEHSSCHGIQQGAPDHQVKSLGTKKMPKQKHVELHRVASEHSRVSLNSWLIAPKIN